MYFFSKYKTLPPRDSFISFAGVVYNFDDIFRPVRTLNGQCYTFNAAESNQSFFTSRPGPTNGFYLITHIQQHNYFAGTSSAGMRVKYSFSLQYDIILS